ncbi:MAG TPA: HAD family phosphatase [Clostridia bacterium]|nr:HAD family phosphatase [Clostridia bacterium]
MYSYIFDIGGVLVKYEHEAVIKLLTDFGGCDEAAIRSLFTEELVYKVQTGRIGDVDFFEKYVKCVMPDITYDRWIELHVGYFEVNPEGLELMLELKKKGRKIYILSNLAEFHKVAIERKIAGLFDYSMYNFLSYEMGYYKPEAEIYRGVVQKTGEPPENLVFFDDLPQNIEGAKKAGIKGILFSNDRIAEIREMVEKLEAEG